MRLRAFQGEFQTLTVFGYVGAAWSEARLIALAYAFEQATKHRRAPTYPKTVNAWNLL